MQKKILKMKCSDIEDFVAQGGDINSFQRYVHPEFEITYTKSLLERAIELGCPDTVRLLVNKGATLQGKHWRGFPVDEREDDGFCAPTLALCVDNQEEFDGNPILFLWSLIFENVEVSQILYDNYIASCDEQLHDKIVLAAMMVTLAYANSDMFLFVFRHGGDKLVNTKDRFQITPFHAVCMNGNVELVQMALNVGANLNVVTDHGNTPLIDAIYCGHEEVALLLLENGANINVQTKYGTKPLSTAKKRKMKRVVAAIEEKLGSAP